jgi:uncharacterized protein (TIGR02001 family)
MKNVKKCVLIAILSVMVIGNPNEVRAGDGLEITPAADFVSRYVWRGLMINDAPNIQPSITMSVNGFELGLWGSSTLAKTNSSEDNYAFSHEADLWLSYSHEFKSGMAVGAMLTDYYFPNGGIRIGNFNNYNDVDGAGAHTIETGVTVSGPKVFPMEVSAFINVYNDEGNNTYFQLNYPTQIKGVGLDLFIGASAGSAKNPGYYGTAGFNIINFGFNATRSIKLSESFSLPVYVTYVLNPRAEVNYLIFGLSL